MIDVVGRVAPGFEPVREAFRENFALRGEIGAGVVVYHRGVPVVELHGGTADPVTGRPWTERTPAICFSATKGLVATSFLMLEDRGLVDLDAPAARWWPELGTNGKEAVTVRQILVHRAGLSAIDAPLDLRQVRDAPDRVHEAPLLKGLDRWRGGPRGAPPSPQPSPRADGSGNPAPSRSP